MTTAFEMTIRDKPRQSRLAKLPENDRRTDDNSIRDVDLNRFRPSGQSEGMEMWSHVSYYSSSRNGAIHSRWQAGDDDIMTGNLSQRICVVIACGL